MGKTVFKQKYGDMAIEILREGKSISEFCAEIGVPARTVRAWRDQNDTAYQAAFAEKFEYALTLSEAWWLDVGRRAAMGEIKMHPTFWIFIMKNRFGWVDNQNITQSVTQETTFRDISKTEQKQRLLAILKENGMHLKKDTLVESGRDTQSTQH